MLSIVHSRLLALTMLALSSASVHSAPTPRILQEPLLGLRYDREKVKFEPLPKDIAVGCHVLNDSEEVKGVWFVFAKASDASGRTYYVLNGYEIDSKPTRDDTQYTAGGFGFILNVDREKCEVLEADARQVFKDRIFDDDFPFDMMQRLATNYATRLVAAYGSVEALRREAAKQRISLERQPEDLRRALYSLRATKP